MGQATLRTTIWRGLFSGILSLACLGAWATEAAAVVIAGGGPNTSPPLDDPGFAYVGQVGNSSGVYLGNGWVLTANHIGGTFSSFTVGSTTYSSVNPVPNSSSDNADNFRLHAVGDPSDKIDLRLFRVTVPTGSGLSFLSPLKLPTQNLSVGENGVMIGRGRGQTSTSISTWYVDVDTLPFTWYTSPVPGVTDAIAQGYPVGGDSTRAVRWATNSVESLSVQNPVGDGPLDGFFIDFDNVLNEGLAVIHDSGSPFFIKRGGTWQIVGIAHALYTFSGQPANTAIFGNQNFYSNLFAFAPQFAELIPEPGTGMLLLTLSAVVLRRRRIAA